MKNKIHAIVSRNGVSSPYSDLFGRKGIQFLQDMELRPCYRQAVDGYLATIGQLNDLIKEVSREVDQKARLDKQAHILMTMPGIGSYSALLILSEIGDIRRFPDARHLVSYAGLAPRVHSSGGKTHYGRITKQGSPWLRWILIEISHHAIRGSTTFRQLNAARVAVARKMLFIIYHMLLKQEEFRDRQDKDQRNQ